MRNSGQRGNEASRCRLFLGSVGERRPVADTCTRIHEFYSVIIIGRFIVPMHKKITTIYSTR